MDVGSGRATSSQDQPIEILARRTVVTQGYLDGGNHRSSAQDQPSHVRHLLCCNFARWNRRDMA